MGIDDIPLLNMLQGELRYRASRQEVISQNIAGADIKGFTRKDISRPSFNSMVKDNMLSLTTTSPSHISGANYSSSFKIIDEGKPVELDMEAFEMGKNNSEFAKAASTYKKVISLMNTALGTK
jgi:flagellar basal-body rod protein FlgB